MPTIGEMIVKLIADTGNFNTDMAEAATTVKASQDAMASSMASSMQAFRDFDSIQKGSISTAEDLAQAQATLNAVRSTGAFTSEELAAKEAIVSASMAKVAEDAKAAGAAMGAFAGNSRTAYTTSALISDALTGQFSRSRREVAALANETGFMSTALRAALSPAGLLAIAVAGVGAAAIEAQARFNKFADVIQSVNGYIGFTAGQLEAVAEKIGDTTNEYDDASTAVRELGASGQFTADQLQIAAQASVQFANLTGEKVSEVDKLMIQMATDPQKALDELVDKYHRITPAQADVIEGLIKEGNTGAATAALIKAMGASVNQSVDEQAQHTSRLAKQWDEAAHAVGEFFRTFGRNVNIATGGGDAAEKIIQLRQQLAEQVPGGATANMLQAQIDALQQIVDKENAAGEAAKRRAETYREMHPEAGSFGAFQKQGLEGIDINGNLTKQLQIAEAAMKTSYGNREQMEEEYWGTVLQKAKAGSAAYIEAWQHVQTLQQQLDERQLQASEEADRKSAESAKEAARDRAKAYSQATKELEQEAEQEAQAQHDADEQSVDDAHTLATTKINAALQADKTLRAEGQITARQLYEDQIAALNQQLTADIQYYQQKAKLDADDAAAAMKWQSAILVDVEKTNAEMLRAQQAYADAVKRINKDIADEKIRDDQRMIMSGFREINQLIGHQETFKQALANIGMEILETQEQNVAKGIAEAFNGEQAKTAAASAGAAERLGITVASEAQALLVQGEAAVKWIITEAAKAAAGAFNAMVSIPYVGPFLAVGASVAAFAAVAKLVGSVSSAAGGWERVPADGMMTELHRDEMVLPAHFANPMRDMVKNGGGMGGVHHHHYNIKAYDRRGLADFVARHGSDLGNGVRRLGRNGHRL